LLQILEDLASPLKGSGGSSRAPQRSDLLLHREFVAGQIACQLAQFARDEPADRLGFELLLPPWFEEKRKEIEAMLEPITVPESNRAEGHAEAMLKDVNKAAVEAADKASKGSKRESGEFVG